MAALHHPVPVGASEQALPPDNGHDLDLDFSPDHLLFIPGRPNTSFPGPSPDIGPDPWPVP